ncbi:MAG: hydrogenase maturation protease [Clostridia bacterium]|nr:hydrogenase maturation protease [Clostridia bacterium]
MNNEKEIIKGLKEFFRDAERIAVIGIGQEWRQDDAVGIVAVERLYNELSGSQELPLSFNDERFHRAGKEIRLYIGADAPESLTGKIRKFKATHVLFVDAAELARMPGEMELVPLSEVKGDEISTHNIPLSVLAKFLELDMGCKVLLLGIQPEKISICFEKKLTPKVDEAASIAAVTIRDSLV